MITGDGGRCGLFVAALRSVQRSLPMPLLSSVQLATTNLRLCEPPSFLGPKNSSR